MSRGQRSKADRREAMRHVVNRQRVVTDETAARFECDDPLHPHVFGRDGVQVFRDWIDFLERVAKPLVEADGDDEAVQAAMALYRKASPYFICTSMVMAARRAGL